MQSRKKLMVVFTLAVGMFATISTAKASPMYYTFTSSVSQISDSGGMVSAQYGAGFGVGSAATYTYLIDLQSQVCPPKF